MGRKPTRTPARLLFSVLAAVLGGVAIGVGVFTLTYAEVPSYFGSDPLTCANCHVMQQQYDAWLAGPHAHVATCNDCHLPHNSVLDKYYVKAEDGLLHATKFTLGDYPPNIVIRDKNLTIANDSCLYCHGQITTDLMFTQKPNETISCVRCHQDVGHN
jgi:cytochrome c nitrite reductase small subunit